jgi:hypothetical protein
MFVIYLVFFFAIDFTVINLGNVRAVFTKMARSASTCINPNLYAVSKINTLEIQKNQSYRTKVARKPLCLQSGKNIDDRPIT